MTFPKLDYIKDVQNHLLFEKWRGKTKEEREANKAEYQRDLNKSYDSYTDAWIKL